MKLLSSSLDGPWIGPSAVLSYLTGRASEPSRQHGEAEKHQQGRAGFGNDVELRSPVLNLKGISGERVIDAAWAHQRSGCYSCRNSRTDYAEWACTFGHERQCPD